MFYLFAGAFKAFGTNLFTIRWLMAVLRGMWLVLVYGLTRRMAPPAWAWLPVACIVAFDAWPIEPEPHPAWPALVACLATIECLARHLVTARRRWLVQAGAATAIGFVFRQNTGAFTALCLAAYLLVRPGENTRLLPRSTQLAFTAFSAALVIWLMHPQLDPLWTVGLLLPVLTCLVALQINAMRASPLVCDGGSWMSSQLAERSCWSRPCGWCRWGLRSGQRILPLELLAGQLDRASLAEALPSVSLDTLSVYLPSLALWVAALGLLVASPRLGALYAYCALFGALIGLTCIRERTRSTLSRRARRH